MAKAKKAKHAGGRPPLPPGERLSTQLGVRLDASSTERLDKLVARLGGEASRPTVLRAASTFGLRALERDPAMLSFTDEVEQAERLLDKHWGVDPRSGVERIGDGWVAGRARNHRILRSLVVATNVPDERRGRMSSSWDLPSPSGYRDRYKSKRNLIFDLQQFILPIPLTHHPKHAFFVKQRSSKQKGHVLRVSVLRCDGLERIGFAEKILRIPTKILIGKPRFNVIEVDE